MVLLHLLHTNGNAISVAHCNFELRGAESDGDQALVQQFCAHYNIPFFVTQFDVPTYIAQHKIGTQEAARNLRYTWFNSLCIQHTINHIAVAHNANDQAETLLYKLARGTGFNGLQGMQTINGTVIRPLLAVHRDDIETYAQQHSVPYRTDSSNNSDKYARNYIRHNALPALQHVNKQAVAHLCQTANYAQQANAIINEAVQKLLPLIITVLPNYVLSIDYTALQAHTQQHIAYLYYVLIPYNLTTTQHNNLLHALINEQSGAFFQTSTHLLCTHNGCIHTLEINKIYVVNTVLNNTCNVTNGSGNVIAQAVVNDAIATNYCNANAFTQPLQLRNWQAGDTIDPLGMKGKTKLVSDILTDKKQSVVQKKQVLVLLSGSKLVFVINVCTAHWARVISAEQKIFSLDVVTC